MLKLHGAVTLVVDDSDLQKLYKKTLRSYKLQEERVVRRAQYRASWKDFFPKTYALLGVKRKKRENKC